MITHMLATIDELLINFSRRWAGPMARIALFVVFFWFGILKVVGVSSANPLVNNLLEQILPFISFSTFIVLFGILEILIGILFLIPKMERIVIFLFALHMVTTFMPLVLLPQVTWDAPFIPTLEGQYIIKNIALLALAMSLAARLAPKKLQAAVETVR